MWEGRYALLEDLIKLGAFVLGTGVHPVFVDSPVEYNNVLVAVEDVCSVQFCVPTVVDNGFSKGVIPVNAAVIVRVGEALNVA